MTNEQLYPVIGVPMLFNAALIGVLIAYVNGMNNGLNARMSSLEAQVSDLRKEIAELRREVNTKIDLLTGKVYELMSRE